jgi:SAM-dependent methyltransferase
MINRSTKAILLYILGMMPARLRMFLMTRIAMEDNTLRKLGQRELLAAIYLKGEGIEIGAAHNPLPLPRGVNAKYIDNLTIEELQRYLPGLEISTRPSVIDDGEKLSTIPDTSQDFVVANHFIEHTQDPIGAIENFLRVLKPGGVIFMAIPDKRWTFDFERPVTPFEHLLKDHEAGPAWSRRGHFAEDARFLRGITDPEEIEKYAERSANGTGNTHFHVWRQEDMLSFVANLKTVVALDMEIEAYLSHQHLMEGIFVLRKGESGKDRSKARASLERLRADAVARP